MRYYLHVLNHKDHSYINIKLTEEETDKYKKYNSVEDFIFFENIGEKYDFEQASSDCMISEKLKIYYKM